jgi:ketosteroid isomerase-like protein
MLSLGKALLHDAKDSSIQIRIMPRKIMTSSAIVSAFVRKINEHDADGLAQLMTPDHAFVDSLGRSFRGRDEMRRGWLEYFALFSDYTITVGDVFEKHRTVVLVGKASGVYTDPRSSKRTKWRIPAAWKAVVANGRVKEWHVFADNFETMKLLKGS